VDPRVRGHARGALPPGSPRFRRSATRRRAGPDRRAPGRDPIARRARPARADSKACAPHPRASRCERPGPRRGRPARDRTRRRGRAWSGSRRPAPGGARCRRRGRGGRGRPSPSPMARRHPRRSPAPRPSPEARERRRGPGGEWSRSSVVRCPPSSRGREAKSSPRRATCGSARPA
jgi:hypothetical protein